MKNEKLYELNPSQEVVKLQCKYSLFKRVVNITMSATSEEKLDFALMKEALNKVIERNDCLRLRFVKKDKKLMQYFLKSFVFDEVPYIEFKTQEKQLSFIQKETAKPIKYLKNEVLKPYFCKTFDGKDMVLVKAAHFILDMYGFNVFFNELFGVYNALKNKTELPEPPKSFEEVIKKDLTTKYNEKKVKSDAEYYKNFFKENEEPAYAGFDGRTNKRINKFVKKGKKSVNMLLLRNDTKAETCYIPKEITKKVMEFSEKNHISPSTVLLYSCMLGLSKHNNVKTLAPLELCNNRVTNLEKKCSGTKVQAVACYNKFDYEKSFIEAIKEFTVAQTSYYRHLGFSEAQLEMIMHKTYGSSMLSTYWSMSFSYIPLSKPKSVSYDVYSNGKCALLCYVAIMHDITKEDMQMIYDYQIRNMTAENIRDFHQKYLKLIEQVIDNPQIIIKDIKF